MRTPSGEVLSAQVLERVQRAYPEVTKGPWRSAVLSAFTLSSRAYGIPRDFAEMVRELRFEPDAYVVNKTERFVHFFEIEVYNPMTSAKLEAYAKLCADMDYYGIEFAVVVVNKHGHINTVDLLPHYLRWLAYAQGRKTA